jgi:hypothetical protein
MRLFDYALNHCKNADITRKLRNALLRAAAQEAPEDSAIGVCRRLKGAELKGARLAAIAGCTPMDTGDEDLYAEMMTIAKGKMWMALHDIAPYEAFKAPHFPEESKEYWRFVPFGQRATIRVKGNVV